MRTERATRLKRFRSSRRTIPQLLRLNTAPAGSIPLSKERAFCAKIFRSKSPPKPDLKSEIVFPARHIGQRPLFVLRDERQLVRNPVLERENLVLVLRQVRRIRDAKVVVDLPADRQPRRRIETLARDDRVDLEDIQPEQAICGLADRIVDYRVGQDLGRSVETGLGERRNAGIRVRQTARRDQRDHVRLR